ncbi:MAG: superoxide dismutase [Ni] [Bacteroidales bacterium]
MKKILSLAMMALMITLFTNRASAHCEVPCGIYDDELRIAMLYEDFLTIEKAMNQITEIEASDSPNFNQLVRWINTKEEHANKVQHIVSQYFITQRIKVPEETSGPVYEKYTKQLALLHQLIVYSMKAKQTTDLEYIAKLRTTLAAFEEVYFEGKHRHKIEHHD